MEQFEALFKVIQPYDEISQFVGLQCEQANVSLCVFPFQLQRSSFKTAFLSCCDFKELNKAKHKVRANFQHLR